MIKKLFDYIEILLDYSKKNIKEMEEDNNPDEPLCVSAIINSWIAVEAFINHIISIAGYASKLAPHEKAFLDEKYLEINEDGIFFDRRRYFPTTTKILFLLNKFSRVDQKKFKKSRLWGSIKRAEKIRNGLVHPKDDTDFNVINRGNAISVRKIAIETIRYINKHTIKGKLSI